MSHFSKSTALTIIGLTLFVAGCAKQAEDAAPAAETVVTNASEAAPEPTAADNADAGITSDAAIAKEDLDLAFKVIDGPHYDKANDQVHFTLEAENKGKTVLSGKGKFPVNLGLTIVGPDGTAKTAPGNLEFQRIRFAHALQPGEKFEFPVVFAAAPTIGGSVVLDGVQEGVSWFRDYGKQTLTLGKFSRCDGNAGTLCGDNGTEIAPTK
jgi:hypothetical protein